MFPLPQPARHAATVSAPFWRWPLLVAGTLTVLLLGITGLYWQAQEREESRKVERDFQRAVNHTLFNIQGRMDAYELVLHGIKGLFDSAEHISAEEFRTYLQPLHLEEKKPGLQGAAMIGWLDSRTSGSALRPEPPESPDLWPAGARAHYAPITYIDPLTPENQSVLGFDVATNPPSWEALEIARDSGEVAITRKLTLAQDRQRGSSAAVAPASLVMYLALYEPQARVQTPAQRRAALRGWVSVQFRMPNLMRGLAEKIDAYLDVRIYDGASLHPQELMYSSSSKEGDSAAGRRLHTTRQMQVGGRQWTLSLQPNPAYMEQHGRTQHSWIAALAALASILLGWLVWLLMTGRDRALALARDMTGALRHTRDDLASTLNAVPDLLFELDLQGRIHHYRFARADLLQTQTQQFDGKRLSDIMSPEAAAGSMAALQEAAVKGYSGGQEYALVLGGEQKWFELSVARKEGGSSSSAQPHFIALSRDITERKKAQAHTQKLAYYDTLTGLPNRALLQERAHTALTAHQHSGEIGALLCLDLDNFKQINDARGHAVGDALLIQVGQRLSHLLRSGDTVARLGGDEFVLLLNGLSRDLPLAAAAALYMGEQVRSALEVSHHIEGQRYSSSASMGITLFPKNGQSMDDLLREADTAMSQAKKKEHHRLCFFEPAMLTHAQESLALAQDVKAALERGDIHAYVQSQVNAQGTVVGGELLLRWHHPVHGQVSPDRFIAVAEESGLILPLGDWVIVQACEALVCLHGARPGISLSVNVSARQFRQDDFAQRIRAILQRTGAPATRLILEITETLLVDNHATIDCMDELVQMGVRFSIDDFGTGYSSLSYLKKLPLFELKIDKSFVQDIPDDANDTAIVQAILAVAQHLKLHVVAEGVETQAQADFLLAHRCNHLQGYLFQRPVLLQHWLAQQLGSDHPSDHPPSTPSAPSSA